MPPTGIWLLSGAASGRQEPGLAPLTWPLSLTGNSGTEALDMNVPYEQLETVSGSSALT